MSTAYEYAGKAEELASDGGGPCAILNQALHKVRTQEQHAPKVARKARRRRRLIGRCGPEDVDCDERGKYWLQGAATSLPIRPCEHMNDAQPLRSDALPPELILSIQRVLELHPHKDSDPLDELSDDFDPVGVVNSYFPNGE